MTVIETRPLADFDEERPPALPQPVVDGERRLTKRRIVATAVAWAAMLVIATVIVTYPLGPVFERRQQHHLLTSFRTEVSHAANAREGLAGRLHPPKAVAPVLGRSVAIVDLDAIGVRQVVIEGVRSRDTVKGPGHVPGTANLGQSGNAVVLGRRTGWGAPFGKLHVLRPGQTIVVTTTQGQSVYRVTTVTGSGDPASAMRPTADDRLTLVTSAGPSPFARGRATVVVASLEGRPFASTPRGARAAPDAGRSGDSGAVPMLVLCTLLFAAAAVGTVVAHRRWKPMTAFLLTMPALVVFAILVAEQASRLLPAWT